MDSGGKGLVAQAQGRGGSHPPRGASGYRALSSTFTMTGFGENSSLEKSDYLGGNMSEIQKNPTAPRHLSAASQRLWKTVVEDYALEEHGLRLLLLACEAFDQGEKARRVLAKDGLTTPTKNGQKTHPAVAVARNATMTYAQLMQTLGVNRRYRQPRRAGPHS